MQDARDSLTAAIRQHYECVYAWRENIPDIFWAGKLLTTIAMLFWCAYAGSCALQDFQVRWEAQMEFVPWHLRSGNPSAVPPQILIWQHEKTPYTGNVATLRCSFVSGASGCYITANRSLIRKSDAIVFDAGSVNSTDLPSYRHASQLWILWARGLFQAPLSRDLREVALLFNWTMSYRQDADVVVPYRNWTATSTTDIVTNLTSVFYNKTRTAIWMISQCEEEQIGRAGDQLFSSRRWKGTERFASAVLHHVQVDLLPNCGAELCTSRDECLSILEEAYFFLFVMESSPCYEHPLQMIYDSFDYNIVSVFFGATTLTGFLPPHSFVDTSRVRNAKEVSATLSEIRSSHDLYTAFFLQRRHFIVTIPSNDICRLCSALYAPLSNSTRRDIAQWLLNRPTCPNCALTEGAECGRR
ncbi:alpha-(1,3)-fucosyltransferase C-like isoform X2 [Haemaphysalis longicornis]